MSAYLLINHLLNFMLPAALIALLLVFMTRLFFGFFKSKKQFTNIWWVQTAIIFVVNVAILTAGLLFFGHDGKMLTYAMLVLGAALCQWLLLRSGKA